ncbi:hypothetical protein [Catenulispora subtropica]|uniref:Uncharacterized protein n=1 Tax=Catenulispora subtropica TaxID=450798 RepID=A0ABP5DWQ6_9ACTN
MVIQHEYGIYGGRDGEEVPQAVQNLVPSGAAMTVPRPSRDSVLGTARPRYRVPADRLIAADTRYLPRG